MLEEAQGMEMSMLYAVTVLGEAYQRRFLLRTSVWRELYAGTRWRAETQDHNRMVQALTHVGHVASPEPERGGQPTPSWCRCAWCKSWVGCMHVVPTIIFRRILWILSAQLFTLVRSHERPSLGAPPVIEPLTGREEW